MTTIAYRAGLLAADSKAYGGQYHASPGEKVKLHRIEAGPYAGAAVGISSRYVGADAFLLDWLNRGAPFKGETGGPPGFDLILLAADGSLYVADDQLALSGPITSDFYAVGSGDDYALGAMAMGASAVEAVEIAKRFDPHTGGTVHVLGLGGGPAAPKWGLALCPAPESPKVAAA